MLALLTLADDLNLHSLVHVVLMIMKYMGTPW
jgi:hypothetical protein